MCAIVRGTMAAAIGVVCMTRGGTPSSMVCDCMSHMQLNATYYGWDTPNLYEVIESSPIKHWFFTGNTPDYVTNPGSPTIDPRIYELHDKSFFFVCYSHQLLCMQLGSPIHACEARVEGGKQIERVCDSDPIWTDIPAAMPFYCWYNQYVDTPPPGWTVLARQGAHVAIMRRGRHYSAQVHPERCQDTQKMIENWMSL
jgi:GMP synthase-like glutamine amidotransferase